MSIKKIAESPFIILLTIADVLYNWGEKAVNAAKLNSPIMDVFGGTNWFDVAIRLLLAYFIWRLYKNFREYKEKVELENKALRKRIRDSIKALDKITNNADKVLGDLWIESRDRHNRDIHIIVDIFKELGVNGIGIKEEDAEIGKYKDRANKLLDEQEAPLQAILHKWDEEVEKQ